MCCRLGCRMQVVINMSSRTNLLLQIAAKNYNRAETIEQTFTENKNNYSIQEPPLKHDNNIVYTDKKAVGAINIYTEDNQYVGSLENNESTLTELVPIEVFDGLKNIDNYRDNLKDDNIVANSDNQFIKITNSCTIQNGSTIIND